MMDLKLLGWRADDYEYNVCSRPERYGLEAVASLEWSDRDYRFDTTMVWRRKSDGTLWTARDSGCSCPTPFEDTSELERLYSLGEIEEEYRKGVARGAKYPTVEEWESFKADVEQALEELRRRQ